MDPFLIGATGLSIGLCIACLFLKARLDTAQRDMAQARAALNAETDQKRRLENERARLEERLAAERRLAEEKTAALSQAQERFQASLDQRVKALSAEALQHSTQGFMALTKEQLAPVQKVLEQVTAQNRELEKTREGAYHSIRQEMLTLREGNAALYQETRRLVGALRKPSARGRWGEIQLHRVVELAGMTGHCDFGTQDTAVRDTDDGPVALRPDLIVRLPGGKRIVVDAKAPLIAYQDAHDADTDGDRALHLERYARHVREHMRSLASKAYWKDLESPEFVVMFLPGENYFYAALEADPRLLEAGLDGQVILASPTTLIALLKAAYYGWQQERLADNARNIADLGRDLYTRLATMGEHFGRMGKSLGQSVDHYNKAMSSLESRVLVQARKFREQDAAPADRTIGEAKPIELAPRPLHAEELLPAPDAPALTAAE